MSKEKTQTRVNDILLGPLERPALQWFSAHMPLWITPDILTGIGILGALIVFAGYLLSNIDPAFLWLASLGLIVNWFGDSLDGTLARYRKIERPNYGFFVDHTVDTFSELMIVVGLGLTPYLRFDVALLALVGYLMMSILVYVRTYVEGVFKISYGKFGPTEVRAIIILINAVFYFVEGPVISLPFGKFSIFDLVVGLIAIVLLFIYLISSVQKARELAKTDG